jgi:hypothetical protein
MRLGRFHSHGFAASSGTERSMKLRIVDANVPALHLPVTGGADADGKFCFLQIGKDSR